MTNPSSILQAAGGSINTALCIEVPVTHTRLARLPFLLLLLVFLTASLATAQDVPSVCGVGPFGRAVGRDGKTILHGLAVAPRNAVRPKNLAWEIPVAAASVLLIEYGDQRTINNVHSTALVNDSSKASDIGIGLELGAGAIGWIGGCAKDNPTLANASLTALAAAGYAQVLNLGMKEIFRRQYPYQANSTGDFFARSRAGSFTSGHATTGFAFAASIAHSYPHKRWVKWGSYALATGISAIRVPAKKHYPSDVLVGAAIGYVTGTYLADHQAPPSEP